MWDWEPTPSAGYPYGDYANYSGNYPRGDSLQGWWSVRNQMTGTGGLTIPDEQRPWRELDWGNNANSGFGIDPDGAGPLKRKRTTGVLGVWHVDGGNTTAVPASVNWTGESDGGVKWPPLGGSKSAWMGLRRHGDTSHSDPETGNPYNEDVLNINFNGSVSTGGTDKKFPGYGAQMDQLLYRDIQLTAGETSLFVTFTYRTSMSTGFGTNNITRQGWFNKDPLTITFGNAVNPEDNNYIQNNFANPTPPVDSFQVYVGAPAEGSVILSDGNSHSIYDAQRRWPGEVIRMSERLSGVPYKQIFSKGGTTAATTVTCGLDGATLASIKAATANKVRLVFRVKTNQTFDDENVVNAGYSSGGVGAVVLDDVTLATNLGAKSFQGAVQGAFEATTDVDNSVAADPLDKWKSTGKPPQPFTHIHQLNPSTGLVYQDLCGQVGNPARICDMRGQVLSAGDHDNGERSGGTFGTAEQEPFQGLLSPTINFTGQAGGARRATTDPIDVASDPSYSAGTVEVNNMGLGRTHVIASDDYYIDYELYTGIFDFFNQGNAWRFGFMAYPAGTTASGAGQHKTWGEIRFPGFIYFNPDKQCFRALDAVKGNGLLRTTNLSGIPDSCRIYLGTRQEVYRFGIPQSEWLDGAYWDNFSLAITDGEAGAPVSVDIWQLFHDTFPFNENPGLPGTAQFDTTSALVKTGINIAPTTGNTSRFDVPGDTTVVIAEGDSVRVDLVFRILPGPGNYTTPTVAGSQLKATPTAAAPIPTPVSGVANFWSNYMFNNGIKGSPGGHPTVSGSKVWSPHVWNAARMDTAEVNVFAQQKRGVTGGPGDVGLFMTSYHETELADPHRGALGVPRNICFVADTATGVATTTVICGSGNVPAGVVYPPVWTSAPGTGLPGSCTAASCKTTEGTKIIPDGLLTPGSHVEYFFRRQDGTNPNVFFCPETTQVNPQGSEGSTDAHRWQEFTVLPDRWKSGSYVHPVLNVVGSGNACMLYVDQNDRRGVERIWVSVADSTGATAANKVGAHNGWGKVPGGVDINDPAYFVYRHIGAPGTTWDMLGVKASESLNTGTGSIGSRGGVANNSFNDAGNTQINGKSSRIGPSNAMLDAYYKVLMILSGDLNSSIFGPFNNKSQNDYKVMQNFLLAGDPSTPNRGIFLEGDGLAEATDDGGAGSTFLNNYLGVTLRNASYLALSGNTAFTSDVQTTSDVAPDGIYGVRNACTFTLDVLDIVSLSTTVVGSQYDPIGANAPYLSGVLKKWHTSKPWIALTDGWNTVNLRGRYEVNSAGRVSYFYNVFANVFGALCQINGTPISTTDTPNNNDGRLFNFMSLANNPMRSGSATIDFGLTKAERVKVQIFDVGGRLVRTLADRSFTAGEHKLTWDGVDNQNRRVERGVYFVRSTHAGGFTNKLVVLK